MADNKTPLIKEIAIKALDIISTFFFFLIVLIVVSGGFKFYLFGLKISAYNTVNPLVITALLLIVRKLVDIKIEIKEIPAIRLLYQLINKFSVFFNKKTVNKYMILFLLAAAFLVRVNGIQSPIIGKQSWRQADGAAMARNYYENGYNFLYPQIDWAGNSAGYIETEFPIYQFTVAMIYKVFGVSTSYGRLLSILCYLISIYFLYLLIKKYLDRNTALWSCLFFAILPLNILYSRTLQPESALVMSLILGVYFFSQWLTTEKTGSLILSSVFIALACLMKIPSLYIGLPILYLAWLKFGNNFFRQWLLWMYALLVLIPVGLWYYHAHQVFLQHGLSFGIWDYGSGKWGNWDLVFSLEFWNMILFERAGKYFMWIAYPLFLIGLFTKRKTPYEKLFDVWLIAFFVYLIIVARGNFAHDYYQFPFMIPAVVYIGKVYSRWFNADAGDNKSLILALCLVAVFILSIGKFNAYIKMENPDNSHEYKLAENVMRETEKNALVVVVDNFDPAILYLSHRKGWHTVPAQMDNVFLETMKKNGAGYIIGNHYRFRDTSQQARLEWLLASGHEVILNDGESFIVKISDER